jgi:hypothetical protein
VSLFGHHHSDTSLGATVAGFVHGVPVPIWVGGLGILAAVATPLVQHLFDRMRDRSATAADARKAAFEGERLGARVRTDLLVRLRAHLAILSAALARGRIDVDRWTVTFDDLARRSREADVIDALGASFHPFADAVHREALAIEAARASILGEPVRVAGVDGIAGVLAGYEPTLAALAGTPAVPALEAVRRGR